MSTENQGLTVDEAPLEHKPFVPDDQSPPELTWAPLLAGTFFGIIFGASSVYLLLKVGFTVSASVPVAVLSITLFRVFSKVFGVRRTTILENNIAQTAGSAGESLAFGVGVTMPALLLLGFEMDPIRVMTVSILGGLLGILMMIPLRRAFIVKQHGKLKYPEGTACAEVLIAGEKGGATAKMVVIGFGIAAAFTVLMKACKFWANEPKQALYNASGGLKGAEAGIDVSPELLGVGYLIGPRVACLMLGGALLSYFVLAPTIATFGANSDQPIAPAVWKTPDHAADDKGLIRNMDADTLRANYLRFIGAGAVAAGGIISMFRALPLIWSSITGGLRDLRASRVAGHELRLRTNRDLSMNVVILGSIGLVLAIASVPQLGLGFNFMGIVGAMMIIVFGFLFVTVSSRLTGEVGSSSNPISGMTIATLLLVCLIFVVLDKRDVPAMLTALSVAAIVCIASSNGGTTSQDLKTGFLVGATPIKQQFAILVGTLVSAVAIGGTLLLQNNVRTHYTTKNLPEQILKVPADAPTQTVGQPHDKIDHEEYRIVHVRKDDSNNPGVPDGRYLVDAAGRAKYRTDMAIAQKEPFMDVVGDSTLPPQKAPEKFKAPQPQLFASIIEGILGGKLEWGLIAVGVLVTLALELLGISALPVAVGMYLPFSSSAPIFAGGMLRWLSDRLGHKSAAESESDTSPGVLLASGFIAGGTLCGLGLTFFYFLPNSEKILETMALGPKFLPKIFPQVGEWDVDTAPIPKIVALIAYAILAFILLLVGTKKPRNESK